MTNSQPEPEPRKLLVCLPEKDRNGLLKAKLIIVEVRDNGEEVVHESRKPQQ